MKPKRATTAANTRSFRIASPPPHSTAGLVPSPLATARALACSGSLECSASRDDRHVDLVMAELVRRVDRSLETWLARLEIENASGHRRRRRRASVQIKIRCNSVALEV